MSCLQKKALFMVCGRNRSFDVFSFVFNTKTFVLSFVTKRLPLSFCLDTKRKRERKKSTPANPHPLAPRIPRGGRPLHFYNY